MTHKEKHLDNKRRKGGDKKREKYEQGGKYNRKKIDSKSGLIEQEQYKESYVGKAKKKKGVPILMD
jgi:hypothetical protein